MAEENGIFGTEQLFLSDNAGIRHFSGSAKQQAVRTFEKKQSRFRQGGTGNAVTAIHLYKHIKCNYNFREKYQLKYSMKEFSVKSQIPAGFDNFWKVVRS